MCVAVCEFWYGMCVCVQYHDGLWKETVSESVGTSLNGPVVFPRG